MAASDHLSPQQFFHGSPVDMPEGTMLVPGKSRGINNFKPGGDNTKVWMSNKPHHASRWGNDAAWRTRRKYVHVYEVEPGEDVQDAGNGSFVASTAKVLRKLNTHSTKRP